jgi:hypothetical protein
LRMALNPLTIVFFFCLGDLISLLVLICTSENDPMLTESQSG